jgi:hypothetical protein
MSTNPGRTIPPPSDGARSGAVPRGASAAIFPSTIRKSARDRSLSSARPGARPAQVAATNLASASQ